MKKIGLIGGMSWESSQVYYQILNEAIRERLGGFHSARCILDSMDFHEIEELQRTGNWERMNQLMAEAAQNLEWAQADCVILCTNTMHLCSEAIEAAINIPFLHIVTVVGDAIQAANIEQVLLLGTRFTMESALYTAKLEKDYGIRVVIPNESDRETVHQVIYDELVQGIIRPESRAHYQRIIQTAQQAGAQGVILGCTEIPLLIKQTDVEIPVFDTTRIHAERAVEFALSA